MTMQWLTNNPRAARKLRAIDKAFYAANDAARGLPLAQKVERFRENAAIREAAFKALLEEVVR